ncbi:MAG: hypothetical protein WBC44_20875 [Planctomycetaceae bacterium]
MSVMNRKGQKVLLPRRGRGFWDEIDSEYARDDPQAWRRLAMLTLKEVAGWPVERIAISLGERSSHIRDGIAEVTDDLRARFGPSTRRRETTRRNAP